MRGTIESKELPASKRMKTSQELETIEQSSILVDPCSIAPSQGAEETIAETPDRNLDVISALLDMGLHQVFLKILRHLTVEEMGKFVEACSTKWLTALKRTVFFRKLLATEKGRPLPAFKMLYERARFLKHGALHHGNLDVSELEDNILKQMFSDYVKLLKRRVETTNEYERFSINALAEYETGCNDSFNNIDQFVGTETSVNNRFVDWRVSDFGCNDEIIVVCLRHKKFRVKGNFIQVYERYTLRLVNAISTRRWVSIVLPAGRDELFIVESNSFELSSIDADNFETKALKMLEVEMYNEVSIKIWNLETGKIHTWDLLKYYSAHFVCYHRTGEPLRSELKRQLLENSNFFESHSDVRVFRESDLLIYKADVKGMKKASSSTVTVFKKCADDRLYERVTQFMEPLGMYYLDRLGSSADLNCFALVGCRFVEGDERALIRSILIPDYAVEVVCQLRSKHDFSLLRTIQLPFGIQHLIDQEKQEPANCLFLYGKSVSSNIAHQDLDCCFLIRLDKTQLKIEVTSVSDDQQRPIYEFSFHGDLIDVGDVRDVAVRRDHLIVQDGRGFVMWKLPSDFFQLCCEQLKSGAAGPIAWTSSKPRRWNLDDSLDWNFVLEDFDDFSVYNCGYDDSGSEISITFFDVLYP